MAAWESLEEALLVGYGIERAFVCPGGHSDNAHASVNSNTGWWYCYSCGSAGRADMSRIEIDPNNVYKQAQQLIAAMNPVHPTYPETYLNLYDALGPGEYWASRFNPATCRSWRVGQALDATHATIPMRDNGGRLLGVIRRDLTGKDHVKYRYPSGISVGNYLWGYSVASGGTLLLTEGATDVLAVDEVSDLSAMACYGSSMSAVQAQLIARYHPDRVLVAFDQDDAGNKGFEKVYSRLSKHFRVERLWWDGYKDLAAIPVAERAEMLQEVVSSQDLTRLGQTT